MSVRLVNSSRLSQLIEKFEDGFCARGKGLKDGDHGGSEELPLIDEFENGFCTSGEGLKDGDHCGDLCLNCHVCF